MITAKFVNQETIWNILSFWFCSYLIVIFVLTNISLLLTGMVLLLLIDYCFRRVTLPCDITKSF